MRTKTLLKSTHRLRIQHLIFNTVTALAVSANINGQMMESLRFSAATFMYNACRIIALELE